VSRALQTSIRWMFVIAWMAWLSFGCAGPLAVSMPATATPALVSASTTAPTGQPGPVSLSEEELATLASLKEINDYPLYTMRYHGAYDQRQASSPDGRPLRMSSLLNRTQSPTAAAWACSLFAALGDSGNMLFGRNFDWEFSPAVLLYTDPPDGYASISMVDIAYLGFEGAKATALTELPLIEREALLDAPLLPFDGMNERGLAIGMAAVPSGGMVPDPSRETIDSLMVIRRILDHASNIDEAVAILRSCNIDMGGGPPLHYLMADASGDSALVEFYRGEMVVIPNESAWHLATNFLRASVDGSAAGLCPRYDLLSARLAQADGRLSLPGAIDLLADVSQAGTQWSVVYGMSTGEAVVIMGREYEAVHTFPLNRADE
jgi:Linear amide C-N hydrolases, choloylglycine hydrolase family